MISPEIIYIGILLLISSFFSWSETAIASCSEAKILRFKKGKKGKRIDIILNNKDNMISTILLCNNIVNILSSAIATGFLIEIYGNKGILIATLIMTALILIFGEIFPKTHALKNPEKSVLRAQFILWLVFIIFSPIISRIQFVVNKIVYLFSDKSSKTLKKQEDIEELKGAIELKHQEGSIIKSDKDMIGVVLNLWRIKISEIMTHRQNIHSLNIDQDIKKLIRQALKFGHSNIPLWRGDKDNIIKILRLHRLQKITMDIKSITKEQFETALDDPWFIPENNNLQNQMLLFRKQKRQFAVVVNEYGDLMGVVTLYNILEQIIGNFAQDDDEQNSKKITKLKGGSYQLPGDFLVRNLNSHFGLNLPENVDQPNIASLIFSKTEKIPEKGEEVEIDGLTFKVLQVKNNKILTLQLYILNNSKKT
jgi:Mg2+/Co2+ transporter CorB